MRIGTIGTNFIVDWFIEAARQAGAQVGAVYSRSEETARAFAQKHGVEKIHTDKKALLEDADLDFIYIASPNSLHHQWAGDALKAGKHVICEKPFVSVKAELEELVALAQKKGLFLFEAITVPHLPNYKKVQQWLGEIGPVKLVQLNFSQYSSRYGAFLKGEVPNVFSPEFSGGALMDLNCYNLHFALGLLGRPQKVAYHPNLAANGIDTSGVLVLEYPGCVCVCAAAKDSKSENVLQIQGEKGFICVPSVSSRCECIELYTGDEKQEYNEQPNSNVLYYEMVEFKEIFETGDFAKRDALLRDSLLAAEVLETARQSAGIRFPADG